MPNPKMGVFVGGLLRNREDSCHEQLHRDKGHWEEIYHASIAAARTIAITSRVPYLS